MIEPSVLILLAPLQGGRRHCTKFVSTYASPYWRENLTMPCLFPPTQLDRDHGIAIDAQRAGNRL